MARIAKAELKELLSEKQRAALLTLLSDDDPEVYRTVRQRILRLGPRAAEWLRPCLISLDPALRRRTREIVLHFERQTADNRFLAFCLQHGEEFDLEKGAWLLAQSEYPGINVDGYRALLDSYASAIRERLHRRNGAREVLGVITEFLFLELGFSGDEDDFCDPQNSYLNRVLDRRLGNPITLCLIYVLLARRSACLSPASDCQDVSFAATRPAPRRSTSTLSPAAPCLRRLTACNTSSMRASPCETIIFRR